MSEYRSTLLYIKDQFYYVWDKGKKGLRDTKIIIGVFNAYSLKGKLP